MEVLEKRKIPEIMGEEYVSVLAQEFNATAKNTGKLALPEISSYAREMAAEGIVLLKNENQTLPIKKEDTVAVFGRCAINYIAMGYGSGGDVIAPYERNLMDGLREHKVKVWESLADKYASWCKEHASDVNRDAWGRWPRHYPEMPMDEQTVVEASQNSDIALYVISQAAGEDQENTLEKGDEFD